MRKRLLSTALAAALMIGGTVAVAAPASAAPCGVSRNSYSTQNWAGVWINTWQVTYRNCGRTTLRYKVALSNGFDLQCRSIAPGKQTTWTWTGTAAEKDRYQKTKGC